MEEPFSKVRNLIYDLNILRINNSPILNSIKNFDNLIFALDELDHMIEMYELKNSIISQVKFLLVNTSYNNDNLIQNNKYNFDGHMLHTVIYGPPGVGKTNVCTILAKIWQSLGLVDKMQEILKQKVQQTKDKNEKLDNLSSEKEIEISELNNMKNNITTSVNKIKNETINKLQTRITGLKENFKPHILTLRTTKLELKYLQRCINNLDINKSKLEEYNNKFNKSIARVENTINFLNTEKDLTTKEENIHFSVRMIDLNNLKSDEPLKSAEPLKSIEPLKPSISSIPLHMKSKSLDSIVTPNNRLEDNNFIRIVSRVDFVGGYLGQSAIKTQALLYESLGKVLFIDEAYSLVNDEKDSYGKEALTVLNKFMSEHSSDIIIIFAGYKNLIEETIFKHQPGLKRRCSWIFEIEGYSEEGLAKIFNKQLNDSEWFISPEINLVQFFKENLNHFKNFGGDTLRLVFYCKICYSEYIFNKNLENNRIITKDILNNALMYLKTHKIEDEEKESYPHLYI